MLPAIPISGCLSQGSREAVQLHGQLAALMSDMWPPGSQAGWLQCKAREQSRPLKSHPEAFPAALSRELEPRRAGRSGQLTRSVCWFVSQGLDVEGLIGGSRPDRTGQSHSGERSQPEEEVTHTVLRVPGLVEGSEDLPTLSFLSLSSITSFIHSFVRAQRAV